jgi:hypothetical protein
MLDIMKTLAVILTALAAASAQSEEIYKARLTPAPIDATMRADVTGSGSAKATLTGTKLTVIGTFEGLGRPATVARLYAGPATGVRGAAVVDLTASKSASGEFKGAVELNAAQVEALRKGRMYIQIGTEKSPDGAIWGWLLR